MYARYCTTSSTSKPTEDRKNLLTLTKNEHHRFDHRHYAVVPSQSEHSHGLELRVLNQTNQTQLIPNYHERALQQITDIPRELFHARLVWSLNCEYTFPFFNGNAEYEALIFNVEKGTCEVVKLRSFEAAAKTKIFGTPRNRSVSPRKRKVGDADNLSAEEDYWSDGSTNSSLSSVSSSEERHWGQNCRGRHTKRGRTLIVGADDQFPSLMT